MSECINGLQNGIEYRDKLIDKLLEEKDKLNEENRKLNEEIPKLKDENDKLHEENGKLKEKNGELEKKNDTLKKKADEFAQDNQKLNSQIKRMKLDVPPIMVHINKNEGKDPPSTE